MMHAAPVTVEFQQRHLRNPRNSHLDVMIAPVETTPGQIYSKNFIQSAKSLTTAQLSLGVVITILQSITTVLEAYFDQAVSVLNEKYAINLELDFSSDSIGAGIWLGALIIITGSIGLSGYRMESRCLIISHIVFNFVALLATIVAISILSISVIQLADCKNSGWFYTNGGSGETTPRQTVMFYGQQLEGSSGKFYCVDTMFAVWSVCEDVNLACVIMEFFLAIILLVYNFLSVTRCCRQCCIGYQSGNQQHQEQQQVPYQPLAGDIEQSRQPTFPQIPEGAQSESLDIQPSQPSQIDQARNIQKHIKLQSCLSQATAEEQLASIQEILNKYQVPQQPSEFAIIHEEQSE